jgi:hypothetical protein
VELQTGGYSDPEDDAHTRTWWQVAVQDDPDLIINETSDTDLASYLAGTGFEAGLKYTWRTAYQDAGSGQYSSWSDKSTFLVGIPGVDENIPPVEPGLSFTDYKMISFIQWPDDPSAPAVFGPMMEDGYDEKEYKIGTYDPAFGPGGYREYPDFIVEPGRSYWFLAREGMDFTVSGVPVSLSSDICIKLKFNASNANGWNMIAPPNDAHYHWGDLQVMEKDGSGNILFGPMPISQLAASNEYIDVRIWSWSDGSYTASTEAGFLLMKYNGYWVRAKKANVYLCFPAQSQVAMSQVQTKLATWGGGILTRITQMFDTLGAAYAEISSDSPPLPMSDFDGKSSGGGGGCFISLIFEKNMN